MALFNALDRNHDGVITRSEFASAMGGMTAAPGAAISYVSPAPAVTTLPTAPITTTYSSPAPAAPPAITYHSPAMATTKPTVSYAAPAPAATVTYASPAPATSLPAATSCTYAAPTPAYAAPAPSPGIQYIVNDPVPMPAPTPQPMHVKPAPGSYIPATAPQAPGSYGTPVVYSQPTPTVEVAQAKPASYVPASSGVTYSTHQPAGVQQVSYMPNNAAPVSYVPTSMPTNAVMADPIYGATAVPVGTEAVVKAQVGQWLICEDGLGEFYSDALTGQSYDDPPVDLLIKAGELRFLQLVQPMMGSPYMDGGIQYIEAPMAAPVMYAQPQQVTYAAPAV
mmetsp:Transcript_46227/g.107479  ORF Transcript_46227/g.107479 Transcript_46227/m.107479 type:complete len:337 (+) Transcript_46227:98-1108(+)